MHKNSFTFGKYDSVEDFGIKCVAYDVLAPEKRQRMINIPLKNGSYDFGAQNYENRIVRVVCSWVDDGAHLPTHALREIAYSLTGKKQIRFWNEPDKYYIGELYNASELTRMQNECIIEFEIVFVCEPFAYSDATQAEVTNGDNTVAYRGTATARPLLILKNTGTTTIDTVYITAKYKG